MVKLEEERLRELAKLGRQNYYRQFRAPIKQNKVGRIIKNFLKRSKEVIVKRNR
jgi:hypothetical protein